jgi:hypothetical protein
LASAADGRNVAVVPERDTVPETAVVPCRNVKVVAFTVDAVTASLNIAVTSVPGLTFVAPFAGAVELTVGGVVSAGADTVKEFVATLVSPWFAVVRFPVSYRFPNQAAVQV